MRALVVTQAPPPRPADIHAIYRRLGIFIAAVGKVADFVEIAHFVPPEHPAFAAAPDFSDAQQSKYWGTPVKVTLVPTRSPGSRLSHYARGIFSLAAHPAYFPQMGEAQVTALEACLEREPDFVFAQQLTGMYPIGEVRREIPPILFDLNDVEHWVKVRSALASRSWPVKLLKLLQAPAFVLAERRAARLAGAIAVCSEVDRERLRQIGVTRHVVTVPNAVPVPPEPLPPSPEPTILFLGGYQYPPNVEAAERLITHIWPLILSAMPTARLIIAGKAPDKIPSYRAAPPRVEFTGLVDDLNALYARSRMICCPLVNGGGTRLKLVEAAAYGKPMVSTQVGAEGLVFENERDILIRDDDKAMAAACVRLLGDTAMCSRLGVAAHARAREMYDAEAIENRIVAHIRGMLSPNVAQSVLAPA